MRTLRRTAATVVTAFVVALITASPASAHGVDGVESSSLETRLLAVEPAVEGIEVRVIEMGSRFELRNRTATDAIVLGYEGEPYLRVGPDGVFTNAKSPATYLNASRNATRAVPESADADASPEWEKIADEPIGRWHDHRAHWMGKEDPPAAQADPDRVHVVYPEWQIPVEHGSQTIVASGDLRWIPPPSAAPFWVLAAVLFVLTVAAGFAGWFRIPAAIAAALVGLDIIHVIGIAGSKEGSIAIKIGEVAIGSFVPVTAWIAGVAAVWLLLRREDFGFMLLAWTGGVIALFGGVVDLADLTRSQVPFLFPPVLARLSSAMAIGAGTGFIVAAVKRSPRPDTSLPEPTEAAGT